MKNFFFFQKMEGRRLGCQFCSFYLCYKNKSYEDEQNEKGQGANSSCTDSWEIDRDTVVTIKQEHFGTYILM